MTIPELIDAQVVKALSKDPLQRQQTIEELKKGLIEAAKRSGIHINSLEKAATYEPSSFDTAPQDEEFVPDVDDAMIKQEQQAQEKKQMQSLVLDAISLTEKQDRERKRLKQYIYGLYALLGGGPCYLCIASYVAGTR